ncbi:hypothetical protein KZ793_19385 [Photorhabdus sp. UCH-936]|nr:hypothetical protein [Photorhabdus antumapuensis]
MSLATAISLFTGIPLAMAGWYPYCLNEMNNTVVQISSEHFAGKMDLNGIKLGDCVSIIDDTLSIGSEEIKDKFAIIKAVQYRKFNFWNKKIIGDICLHIMA